MFRRRKDSGQPVEEPDDDAADTGTDQAPEGAGEDEGEQAGDTPPAPVVRPQGPWDVEDAPDDDVNRVDLGGMRVPVPPDTEVRVDVGPEGQIVAATLVRDDSAVQVNCFAAPRSAGIWSDVRAEIVTALQQGGGQVQEVEGRYGPELQASVPTAGVLAPARFLGIDGPRWFVRALVTGPAATDPAVAEPLEQALRDLVVVRGNQAMAVRDPLPLALPKDVAEQAAAAQAQADGPDADDQPDRAAPLTMPERGPEITETR